LPRQAFKDNAPQTLVLDYMQR
jgi:hypothetical protein